MLPVDCMMHDERKVSRVDESSSVGVPLRHVFAALIPDEDVEFSDDASSLFLPLSFTFTLSFLELGLWDSLATPSSYRS